MKIYDGSKIIPGVIIFFALVSFPVWYSASGGRAADVPQPEKPAQEKQCVESTQYMKDNHMEMLNMWRESVVRDDARTYVASDGKKYDMSLKTCLGCHTSKEKFCDQCHNYVSVKPTCWDCHNAPEGVTGGTK